MLDHVGSSRRGPFQEELAGKGGPIEVAQTKDWLAKDWLAKDWLASYD